MPDLWKHVEGQDMCDAVAGSAQAIQISREYRSVAGEIEQPRDLRL